MSGHGTRSPDTAINKIALHDLISVDRRSTPRIVLAWLCFDWAVIALCWFLMATIDSGFVLFAGMLVIASRIHALGVILHDACHRPAGRLTAAWWAVEILAGWAIGSTTAAMRYHHLRHHRTSGTRVDPYWHPLLAKGGMFRILLTLRGLALPLWWSLRAFVSPLVLLWPRARTVYARLFLQDRSGQDLSEHPEVLACARADLLQAGAHCVVIAIVIEQALPFVTGYLLPWMLAGALNAHRVIAEHSVEKVSEYSREAMLATTHTHTEGRIVDSFLYPHNIGYHQAHHLYPAASFVHLPSIHTALSKRAIL